MIYRKIFVCWEKTNEDISAKHRHVCKCYIWVTNLVIIYGEVLPNHVLPRQSIKVELLSQLPSNNTKQNLPKTSCKPVDYRQNMRFTNGLDLCPDLLEVVARQASFPFHIHVSLTFSSCGYIQFAVPISCVLVADLRQVATDLNSKLCWPYRHWG